MLAYMQNLLYLRPPPPYMGTPSKVQSHFAEYMAGRVFFREKRLIVFL